MFTRTYFIRKLIVSILSSLLISLLLAIMAYTSVGQRMENTSYTSFIGLFLVYLILVSPVYLIGGNAFSIIVDIIWNRSRYRNVDRVIHFFINALIYAIGGCVLLIMYLFLFFKVNSFSVLAYVVGVMAGILYYILDSRT